MIRRNVVMPALAAAAIFTLFGNPVWGNATVMPARQVGTAAPDFAGKTVEGGDVSLAGLRKNAGAVILNFWGLRCGACIEEMPHLTKIAEDFREKGIAVVGVNVDGADVALLKELMDGKNMRPGYTIVADPEFLIAESYQLTAAPLTFIVDREGMIRFRHENYSPGDETKIRDVLNGLLKGH